MKLLLDTHVLLALVKAATRSLPSGIRTMLDDPDNQHHVSVASLWEIAIKARLGKLDLPFEVSMLTSMTESMGTILLTIDARHALAAVEPKPSTRDPFDNMLLAQCQVEGLRLLTMDRALIAHPLAAKLTQTK